MRCDLLRVGLCQAPGTVAMTRIVYVVHVAAHSHGLMWMNDGCEKCMYT